MCLQRYPYLKASSASCFSFVNLKLRFTHRLAEVAAHTSLFHIRVITTLVNPCTAPAGGNKQP
ncbi:MAG: hypothetical protein ACI8SK_000340 [Shewanella sp.]|jgi:hypothetical protein